MSLLKIRTLGDPVLRSQSRPVKEVTDKTKDLIDNMLKTMQENEGVGLAAPQIGILKRIIVVSFQGEIYRLINPEILKSSGKVIGEEGCLSIPGKRGPVARKEVITVRALNEKGKTIEFETRGMLARIIQHEIDHLNGDLFIDKLLDMEL